MDWENLPSRLAYDEPERLTDVNSWHTHIPFGFWCVEATRPRVLVELGTHKGDSYAALCQAVKRLALPTACFAVDTWRGDHEAGYYGDEVLEELRAFHDPRFASFSRLVRSTFDEALRHFADGSIDLLHIDGLHTHEAVRHDFESWLPKLSARAVVLFHDINVRELDFGAWRFWEDVRARYPHFTFLHGHGLGVLQVGPDAPQAIRELVACPPEAATGPRTFFARLGHQVELRAKVGQLKSEVGALRSEVGSLKGSLEEADHDRARYAAEAGRLEAERARLDAAVAEQQEGCARAIAEAARATAAQLEALRAEADRGSEPLRDRLATLQAEHDQRTKVLAAEAEALQAQAREGRAAAQALEAQGLALARQFHFMEARRRRRLTWLEGPLRRLSRLAAAGPLRKVGASLWRRVVVRRIAASGLFDAAHYRASYPFLSEKVDPLRHYVRRGAQDGLNPHPMFDTAWYLRQVPEVQRRGLNPFFHYLTEGAAQGGRPHPRFSAAQLLAGGPAAPGQPLGGQGQPLGATVVPAPPPPPTAPRSLRVQPFDGAKVPTGVAGPRRPRTILLSHVFPFPSRAGNEYRFDRLLRWLEGAGHEVVLVVAPLPGEHVTATQLALAAGRHANLVVCTSDGVVRFQAADPGLWAALAAADGRRVHGPPAPQGGRVEVLHAETTGFERTFCPDHLLDLLGTIVQAAPPDVFIAGYVWTSRALLRLGPRTLRVIDTIDVFSTKAQKVLRFGVKDSLAISTEAEASMLTRADLVVAIQPEEGRELVAIAPEVEVVTAGVDFDMPPIGPPPAAPVVLLVASSNAMNVRGLADFVSLAWPLVRRERPDAVLRVVGPVGETLVPGVEGVEVLGRVDDLGPLYAAARLVINPAAAGTGVKIKTLESLANLRPLVTWPAGVDGLSAALTARCAVTRDWYQFARAVLEQLSAGSAEQLFAARAEIARELAAETVYAELGRALERHLGTAAGEGKRDA